MPAGDYGDIFQGGKPNTAEGRASLAENQTWWNQYLANRSPQQRAIENYLGNPGHSKETGISGFLDKWAPAITGALITAAGGPIGAALWSGGQTAVAGGSVGDVAKNAAIGAGTAYLGKSLAPVNSAIGETVSDVAGDAVGDFAGDAAVGAIGGAVAAGLKGGNIGRGALTGGVAGGVGGVISDVTGSSTLGSLGGKLAGSKAGSYFGGDYGNPMSGGGSATSLRGTTGGTSLTTPAQSTDLSQLPTGGNASTMGDGGSGGLDLIGNLGSGGLGLIGNLGSGASDLLTGKNLGYGAAAGLGLYEANQAKQQNQNYANTLQNIGKPYTQAGQDLLTAFKNGTLTPAQQQQIQNLQSQGKTLTDQANPLLSGGTNAIQAANAGQLPSWQQAQIDQQVAQQKAQLRQSLGANVDSSTLAQYDAQIDQQAAISKGNLVQQNLQSGMAELGQGTALEQQGQADIQAGYKAANDFVQQSFQNSLASTELGFAPTMEAISLMIQGDSQIESALMGFMGNLAKAYMGSSAPGGIGGGGGQPTGGGSAASGGGNPLKQLIGNLGGGSGAFDNIPGDQYANQIINEGAGNQLSDPLAGYDPTLPEIDTSVPDLSELGGGG